jgi:transposase-like protein
MKSKKNKQQEYKKVSCPFCKGNDIVKRGSFQTEAHGKQQRYFCKSCNKKFIERNGFYRMRNNPQKITCALDLFYNGVSTRKVQQHFKAFFPHNCSNKTIYKWVIKYSSMISNFTDSLKLQVGKEVQLDEMEYHRRKFPNKKGVSKDWFIDSIDCKTRYMVSSKYFTSRGQNEIKDVLVGVKKKTEGYVTTITTDGYTAYANVIKKTWGWSNKKQKYNMQHKKVTQLKGEGFNIMIERMHNSIRERTKVFRGFHGSVESAEMIMKGYEIYYNFIRKHQAIKCCPYELAIPELKEKLNNPNKWLSLIELSNKNL